MVSNYCVFFNFFFICINKEKEKRSCPKKNGQRKALCLVGSLSSYFRLKSRKKVQGQESFEHQENEEYLEEVIRD